MQWYRWDWWHYLWISNVSGFNEHYDDAHTCCLFNASVEVYHFDRGARYLYNLSLKKDKQRFLSWIHRIWNGHTWKIQRATITCKSNMRSLLTWHSPSLHISTGLKMSITVPRLLTEQGRDSFQHVTSSSCNFNYETGQSINRLTVLIIWGKADWYYFQLNTNLVKAFLLMLTCLKMSYPHVVVILPLL